MEGREKQVELEDFMEPEIAVTAAVAAAITSPRARKVMRKGLVYGMAGILAAGDVIVSFGRSVREGIQHAGEEATPPAQNGGQAREGEEESLSASRRKTEDTKGKSV